MVQHCIDYYHFLFFFIFKAGINTDYLDCHTVLSLVALGLSVGCEAWPPIRCHHLFVIGRSKYRLGLPQSQWLLAYVADWNFQHFSDITQSPCTALTAGICLPLGLCKGTVKESTDYGCPTSSPTLPHVVYTHFHPHAYGPTSRPLITKYATQLL